MSRRLVLNVLAIALVLGFVALGRWQLGREQVKRQQLAEAAAALAAPPRVLSVELAGPGGGIARVEGEGRFLPLPRLWLDNQRRAARVGVRLYCGFEVDGAPPLLVDLGWLPIGADRTLPAVACPQGRHRVAGLLVPPPAVGLRLGPGLVAQDGGDAWLATRLDTSEVQAAWRLSAPLAGRVLRLDPALPLGHERDLVLHANSLPPEKHRGYALQWFGLAVATFVTTLILNRRRRP